MKLIRTAFFTIIIILTSIPASGLTVEEIVDRSNQSAYYKGTDGSAVVSMIITDSQQRTRNRKFNILRLDIPNNEIKDDLFCGDQKYYVYFQLPADVNKMVFMVWKHLTSDDDRWLYLPALDLVKRISSNEKRTSFVGSDFFYEDVSGRNINDDTHKLLKEDDNFYTLENIPKQPDTVEFSHYTAWVHKKTFLAVKIEYFDRKGDKYREYEALNVEYIQSYPTVTKARMKDLRTGSETVLEYSNIKYDIGLSEDIFTERYLRRAPSKYFK